YARTSRSVRANRVRIISWNVNGIRAAHRKGFVSWLARGTADIVCVQETKIDADTLRAEMAAPAPGHHAAFAFAVRKGYSGVATFSREAPRKVRVGIGIAQFDDEG